MLRLGFSLIALALPALLSLWPQSAIVVSRDLPALGRVTVLTYNVAGLPQGISQSQPKQNTPVISSRIRGFDLVLVQEDFCFHHALTSASDQEHLSRPEYVPGCTWGIGRKGDLGDGLNRLSTSRFRDHARHDWSACHGVLSCGTDCLAAKGFTVAEHTLGGEPVHVYNLHMDAGGCDGDRVARRRQVEQLIAAMERYSSGVATIVAGDFNLAGDSAADRALLAELLERTGLADACRSTGCADERLDRVLFRSSSVLQLIAESWAIPQTFLDSQGQSLSDHEPVLAHLGWLRVASH